MMNKPISQSLLDMTQMLKMSYCCGNLEYPQIQGLDW